MSMWYSRSGHDISYLDFVSELQRQGSNYN